MIGRNTLLITAGTVLPLALGLVLVPVLTGSLGPERFGLLSIAWVVLEYSALFDVGLGRATTRAVTTALARGGRDVSAIVGTSLVAQLLLGLLGGAILALGAPWLAAAIVERGPLAAEARTSFLVLAATVPLILLGGVLRGLLEAAQRFDLSTAVRIPSSSATFIVSAVAAAHGATLPQILWLLLLTRAVTCAALAWAARVAIPTLRWRWPGTAAHLRPLLGFGGWVALSSVVSPLLLYSERMLLGAAVGLTAVAYYAAPYEAVSRLLILPASLVTVLFPAVSAMAARADRDALLRVLGRSVRSVVLVLLPVVCVLIAFAEPLLGLWLGPAYAARSATILQLLAFGALCNAAAYAPFVFVQALGRPDITGRLHVAELVVYLPLAWLLVSRYGAVGAALAWTARVTVDAALVAAAATWLLRIPPRQLLTPRALSLVVTALALLAALFGAAAGARRAPAGSVAAAAAALALFAVVVWRYVASDEERRSARALFGGGARASLTSVR